MYVYQMKATGQDNKKIVMLYMTDYLMVFNDHS